MNSWRARSGRPAPVCEHLSKAEGGAGTAAANVQDWV